MEPILIERPLRKTDVSNYVPRKGGGAGFSVDSRVAAFFVLVSTVMLTCETDSPNVSVEALQERIQTVWIREGLPSRKLRDIINLLVAKELLVLLNEEVRLTTSGIQLGIMYLKDVRLDYPEVEQFIEQGQLQKLEDTLSEPLAPKSSQSSDAARPVLPQIHWPLPPPPPSFVMGDWKAMDEEDPKPISIPQGAPVRLTDESEWKVMLLLDNREVRTMEDRSFMQNRLYQSGVECEVRILSLGDMQWVLHHTTDGEEIMMNVLVERKNVHDLAMSIFDGRFDEQQYRLKHCGVTNVIYLIEGTLRSQDMMSADSLQASIMTTIVNRGIYVYLTTSIDDTIVFLKGLNEIMKVSLHRYFERGRESCIHPHRLRFGEFQALFAKTKGTKLKSLWCKQLRQVRACWRSEA